MISDVSRRRSLWVTTSVLLFWISLTPVLGTCASKKAPKPDVPFSELLRFKRDIPVLSPDSSHVIPGPKGLAAFADGFLVADGGQRRLFLFRPDGRYRKMIALDTLHPRDCLSWLSACVSAKGQMLMVYDPLTNSVCGIDLARDSSVPVKLSGWRVDSWGGGGQRALAIGPLFSEEAHILVRSFDGSTLTDVCDITSDLLFPRLFREVGTTSNLIVKQDDGFCVLEAASLRIIDYSAAGKRLAMSTERPQGFRLPTQDVPADSRGATPEIVKQLTPAVSFAQVGDYLLVSWVAPNEPKCYLEVFDLTLHLRLSKIEIPAGLSPGFISIGNSVFFPRATGTCDLPRQEGGPTKARPPKPFTLAEFEFVASRVER